MSSLTLMLQAITLVCLLCAALNLAPNARVAWGWLGFFFWVLSFVLGRLLMHTVH